MTTTKRRLVSSRVGWVLVTFGLALGIVAAILLARSVGPALNAAFFKHSCATPCSQVLGLNAGRYLVFEQTGDSNSVGPVTTSHRGPTTITQSDVVVTSADGRTLDVFASNGSETITRNGTIYTGAVSFRVPESGRYRVSVHAPGATHVIVAPGIGQLFAKALPGVAVAVVGLVAGTMGIVVLILAWTRRRSAAPAAG